MPEKLTAAAAKTFSRLVKVTEAKLAFELYKEFNRGAALGNLQSMARNCINQMLQDPGPLGKALEKESHLVVYRKTAGNTIEGLERFLSQGQEKTLNATEVSDIIRLFGEFVEQGGLAHEAYRGTDETDDWGTALTPSWSVKQAYRGVVAGSMGSYAERAGKVWAEAKKDKKTGGTIHIMPAPSNPNRAFRDRGPGRSVEWLIDFREDKTAFSGLGDKRAQNDSNILKIDRLFGLIVGADISGTTADTVFAMETQGTEELTKIYYMLPLATIVYNNHHALLEVALALTINGVIDYNIGFYTSLLPKGINLDGVNTVPPALQEIPGILAQFENSLRDRRLVTFYDDHQELAGGYLFTDAEAKGALGIPSFNAAEWLRRAPNLPAYPTEEIVDGYFRVRAKFYHQMERELEVA